MEADYPADPIGHTTSGFTPINKIKEEPTASEPSLDEPKGVKQEPDVEDAAVAPPTPTVTPKKRGKKAQNGSDAAGDETPTKKAKGTPAKANPIPATFENAGPEDRMILHMKDSEGKAWTEIAKVWESMTGKQSTGGSLRVRYSRMKANFVTFDADHVPVLLEAKKEIESQLETEKWHKISGAVEAKCGGKYPIAVLQKKFREVSKKAPIVVQDE